jgi:hypothetical protein
MRSVNIGVVPKGDREKIPVDIAGGVMVNVQLLFRHIGEYLISKELKLQNKIDRRLSDIFSLYVDPSMSISLRSSTRISTSGIIDNALALLESTLVKLSSGTGGYWIDDTYSDPRFRRIIAEDVIRLMHDLGPDFSIKVGANTLDNIDVSKIKSYMNNIKMTYDDVICGVLRADPKSRRSEGVRLAVGDERVKMSFDNKTAALVEAEGLINAPVIVGGRIRLSGDRIAEISDVRKVIPFDTVKFKRMLSSDGDVALTTPLEVKVDFDERANEWVLKNDSIGARVTKKDWDSVVTSFHDFFVFLWNEYTSDEHQLNEEEMEIRDFFFKLVVDK